MSPVVAEYEAMLRAEVEFLEGRLADVRNRLAEYVKEVTQAAIQERA